MIYFCTKKIYFFIIILKQFKSTAIDDKFKFCYSYVRRTREEGRNGGREGGRKVKGERRFDAR